MAVTFTHHRFGRGAARLALGRPTTVEGLASAARDRAPFERGLIVFPPLLGLLLAIGFSVITIRLVAPIEETLLPKTIIQLDAWEVSPSTPPVTVKEKLVAAHLEKPLAPAAPTNAQSAQDSAPEIPHTVPFDPRSLVTKASPSISIPEAEIPLRTFPRATQRRTVGKARQSASPTIEIPIAAPHQHFLAGQQSVKQAVPSSLEAHRPSPQPNSELNVSVPNGLEQAARKEFLSAHAMELNASRGSGNAQRIAPPVALANKDFAFKNTLGASSHGSSRNDAWHAVPLDDLPDCSPPGRQDQLKQQILVAAPDEATCENQDGSFRFLETRNLNAFLMWSRTHPAALTVSNEVRDVCDVLERALRCLGEPSTQELGTR